VIQSPKDITDPDCLITRPGVQTIVQTRAQHESVLADPVAHRTELVAAAVRTVEQFEALSDEWQDLFDRSGCTNVFLGFDWMMEWWKHWGHRRKLFIVTVREGDGRLVGLAPFSLNLPRLGGLGADSLRFIADEFVGSDHLDLLVDTAFESGVPQAIARFVLRCRGEWDYVCFSDCQDSSVLSVLRQHLCGEGMREHALLASNCPYIPLPASYDAYLAGISAKLRANFRRRYKSLQKEGPLEFLDITDPSELERRFEDLVRLHGLRFEGQKVESAFVLPMVKPFHRDVVKRLAARGWARLYLLELAGRPIGAFYGFSIGGKFSFYQCGRDPAWQRFGVGQVLTSLCIEEVIKTGHHEFDFLRGGEIYKADWTRHTRETVSIWFFDRRFKSQLARLKFHVGVYSRSLSHRLRKIGTIFHRGSRRTDGPPGGGGE
jgi:CelD/BcsL family acetyltransferase involved in cellulose biosynthesis